MPRLNDVFLVGLVAGNPSAKYDKEGNLVQMALPLLVIHGTRSYGEKTIKNFTQNDEIQNKGYDNVWVLTENEEITKQIKECKPYDIVEVKGALRVSLCNKKSFCPECGTKHVYPSSKTSIYPIHFLKRADMSASYGISTFGPEGIPPETEGKIKDASIAYLKKCIEISNIVRLIGVVSKEPELYQRDSDGRPMLTFPLAVIRKFYISEDNDTDNIDFVYVKFYGKNARQNYGSLHKGDMILIDGFVQSRNIKRKILCPSCECQYIIADSVSEAVPYSVEYLYRISPEGTTADTNNSDYKPQIVGSEADINLRDKGFGGATAEEKHDTDAVTGEGANKIDDIIQERLAKLKSE